MLNIAIIPVFNRLVEVGIKTEHRIHGGNIGGVPLSYGLIKRGIILDRNSNARRKFNHDKQTYIGYDLLKVSQTLGLY